MSCCLPRRVLASISFRITSIAGGCLKSSSAAWKTTKQCSGAVTAVQVQDRGSADVPRRLENDRWLFGVTLALCLLGAVMIYSASAVTAGQQYGRSYIFLLRQTAWLLIGVVGMFALMRTDYRRLREPAVVYTTMFLVLLMLCCTFFVDKSHATHRWIRFGPVGIQPSELAKIA